MPAEALRSLREAGLSNVLKLVSFYVPRLERVIGSPTVSIGDKAATMLAKRSRLRVGLHAVHHILLDSSSGLLSDQSLIWYAGKSFFQYVLCNVGSVIETVYRK
jgi:hypothetical protein